MEPSQVQGASTKPTQCKSNTHKANRIIEITLITNTIQAYIMQVKYMSILTKNMEIAHSAANSVQIIYTFQANTTHRSSTTTYECNIVMTMEIDNSIDEIKSKESSCNET